MLNIQFAEEHDFLVISLEGRFDGSGGIEFDKTASNFPQNSYPILDFGNVQYLSSAGIRSIIGYEKKLRKNKGRLIVVSLPPFVKQVLEVTGILSQLLVADSVNDAKILIKGLKEKGEVLISKMVDGCEYTVNKNSGTTGKLRLWNERNDKRYTPVNLSELQVSFGEGSIEMNNPQGVTSEGKYVNLENFFGIKLNNEGSDIDYIMTEDPSNTHVFLKSGVSFPSEYNYSVKVKSSSVISLNKILKDLFYLIPQSANNNGILSFLLLGNLEQSKEAKSVFALGVAIDEYSGRSSELQLGSIQNIFNLKTEEHIALTSNCAFFKKEIDLNDKETLKEKLKSKLEHDTLVDINFLSRDASFSEAVILVYSPCDTENAENGRLKIEFEKEQILKDEFEIIIRNIYSDCSSIFVKQLHGGYSAQTFMVDGYDHDRKRIIPTVLKLGNLAMIKRERDRYEEFVKKYILNNSVSILGSYFYGDWGGVRYNFVGINGPESKLKWLTLHYKERPIAEFLPLLKKVFTEVLLPWYGQPRLEILHPYKEHDPTAVFFKHIYDEAEKNLGISAEDETIFVPVLNRNIVNPYWYLKYKYREKEKYSKLWYKCICHGDLNMQNILVDEIENIYIIDFSETKVRNAVSDFARIEPIVKNENVRLDTEDDLKELLKFEEGLLVQNSLDECPVFYYSGNDPMVEKAFKTICLIRKYAKTVTLFENDVVPYLLAVLEWTLPIVCYYGVDNLRKKYSAYSSALMLEKIESLEKKKSL